MISREEFLERIEVAYVLTLIENDDLRKDFEDDLVEDYLKTYVRVSEIPNIDLCNLLLAQRRSKDSYQMMLDTTFGKSEQHTKALTLRIAATKRMIEMIIDTRK